MQTQCQHGERVRREGTSAKGPWVGWFCPLKKGDPNQCKPEFEGKGNKATPTQKFNAGLHETVQAQREDKKDDTVTRLAIIKSMLEGGRKYEGITTVKEFYQWYNLAIGKTLAIETKEAAKVGIGEEEIDVQSIPF